MTLVFYPLSRQADKHKGSYSEVISIHFISFDIHSRQNRPLIIPQSDYRDSAVSLFGTPDNLNFPLS